MPVKSTTRTKSDLQPVDVVRDAAAPIGSPVCGSGSGISVWVDTNRDTANPLDIGESLVSAVAYRLWQEFGDDPCANWSEAERIVALIVVPGFLKPRGESK